MPPITSISVVPGSTTAQVAVTLNWVGGVYVDYNISPATVGRRVVSEARFVHPFTLELLTESITYAYEVFAETGGVWASIGTGTFTTTSSGFTPLAPQNVWVVSKPNHRVIHWDFVTKSVDKSDISPRYAVSRGSRPSETDMVEIANLDQDTNLFVDFVPRDGIFYYKITAELGSLVGASSALAIDLGFQTIQDRGGEEFLPSSSIFDDARFGVGRFGV